MGFVPAMLLQRNLALKLLNKGDACSVSSDEIERLTTTVQERTAECHDVLAGAFYYLLTAPALYPCQGMTYVSHVKELEIRDINSPTMDKPWKTWIVFL